MAEFDCKKCLHEKVCALWASRESQDASCFCTDGCDYFTPTLTPPNEPLTLEQLREMEGQPVWVKCLKPNKYINPPVRWRILEKSIMGTFGVWDGESCLSERDYGTDWLAYRRPPEGES